MIPTFKDITTGTASYDLQSIKLIGAAGDGSSESIVVYDADALVTGEEYFYQTVDGYGAPKDGWYDDGDNEVTGVKLPLGTGLYMYLTDGSVEIQFAGEVTQSAIETEFENVGYNMIGNGTPVPIDLQDIKLVGAVGDGSSESIVVYDADALVTGEEYFYQTEDGYGAAVDGWYDPDDQLVSGYTLEPGQGVYVYITNEGVKFRLPSCMNTVE